MSMRRRKIDRGSLPPPCRVRTDRQDTSRHIQYGLHIWLTLRSRGAGWISRSVRDVVAGGATRSRADRGGVVCAGRGRIGGGTPARHLAATSFRVAQDGACRLLSLPADEAPLFVPVVTELRSAGPGTEAAARSSTTISIEIGGAVVRVAVGVDPAWLRDVLRAVRAAT